MHHLVKLKVNSSGESHTVVTSVLVISTANQNLNILKLLLLLAINSDNSTKSTPMMTEYIE